MAGGAVPIISYENVAIAYGRKTVVPDLSLAVRAGETFGLMGLNGAGKTTMLKVLLGLRDHSAGRVLIDGCDRGDGSSRRMLAYLPERFDPPWFLRGDEFIKFSMRLYARPFERDAMHDLAVKLDLAPDVLKNRVQTYSKGMRQKLGIMATMLTGCGLIVLDEPMSGLDPRARAAVKDVLKDAQSAGRTIFFSSHILSDMDEICGEVAVLHRGKLLYQGAPAQLKARGGADHLERAFLNVINEADASGN